MGCEKKRGRLLMGRSAAQSVKSLSPQPPPTHPMVFGRRWYSLAGELVVLLFPWSQ